MEQKSEYRVIDNQAKWVTFDTKTNAIIKLEKYNHQDGNLSNLCASEWCRCSD